MKKDIFSGIGLGLLMGTIIGLSIAEVTGIILAALTSLLAAFFGLRATKDGENPNQWIIGSFGITCLLSIFLGLFIRTHNLFSPSLQNQVKEYRMASFDSSEIKKIILFKEFGLIPEGYTYSKEAKQMNTQSVLMTDEEQAPLLCSLDENATLAEIKRAFDDTGIKYQQIERQLTAAIPDENTLRNTLQFFKNMICEKQHH